MAILACETFTQKFCCASLMGGTLLARLEDGAICFLPMGKETNTFRRDMSNSDTWNVDNIFNLYHKQYKKDKYVTVHKQGHFIQLHNRPLGDKPWATKRKTASSNVQGELSIDG